MKAIRAPKPDAPHKVKETKIIIRGIDVDGRSTINQYTLLKKLGEGTYGKVKLGSKGEKEERYAIKIVKKAALKKKREMVRDEKGRVKYKDAFENVIREVQIMKQVDHPGVVRLHEVIDGPTSDKMYIIMNYADKGQVIEWDDENMKFYPLHRQGYYEEKELRSMFRQMVAGLEYLHEKNIIHRDIKPQNVLEDSKGQMIIGDLGVAALIENGNDIQTKTEGTYHFQCPESLNKDGTSEGYSGKAADIWALGITFFAFVYYAIPFKSDDLMELFEQIENKPVEFPNDRDISSSLKSLLTKMLEKNPRWRATMEDLKGHAFFTEE